METIFTLGNVPVTAFGLGMAAAMVVLFLGMAMWNHRKSIGGYTTLVRFAVLALPLTWFFSRLIYVAANCTYYLTSLSNPVLALYFWDGGYSVTGAAMGVLSAAFLTEKWLHKPASSIMDAAAFAMPLALVVERLMERGTGLGLGRPITYEWLMFMGIEDGMGDIVYPVYIYEMVTAALIFMGVALWQMKRGFKVRRGDTCLTVLALLGASQVLLESLRNDGHMVVHFVRIQQVLSLLAALLALFIFARRLYKAGGIKKSQQLMLWLITLACVGLGIFMEFRVDRGSMKMLYYAVMTLCMAVIAAMALRCRAKAEQIG